MIAFHAISGRSGKQIRGGGLQHVCLDAQNGLGGICVDIRSQAFGTYADLLILGPGTYGIALGVVTPPLADHRDTQNCTFDNVRILGESSGGRCLTTCDAPIPVRANRLRCGGMANRA